MEGVVGNLLNLTHVIFFYFVHSLARIRALRDFRQLAKESKLRNREITERVDQQTRQLESKQSAEFTVCAPFGTWVIVLYALYCYYSLNSL